MKQYINNKKYVSCDELSTRLSSDYGVNVSMEDIHRLVDPYCRRYNGGLISVRGEWFYNEELVWSLRRVGDKSVKFVEEINKLKAKSASQPKQSEDDLEYMPNTDVDSVRKWNIDKNKWKIPYNMSENKKIKLKEDDIINIVKESVNRIAKMRLNESIYGYDDNSPEKDYIMSLAKRNPLKIYDVIYFYDGEYVEEEQVEHTIDIMNNDGYGFLCIAVTITPSNCFVEYRNYSKTDKSYNMEYELDYDDNSFAVTKIFWHPCDGEKVVKISEDEANNILSGTNFGKTVRENIKQNFEDYADKYDNYFDSKIWRKK